MARSRCGEQSDNILRIAVMNVKIVRLYFLYFASIQFEFRQKGVKILNPCCELLIHSYAIIDNINIINDSIRKVGLH